MGCGADAQLDESIPENFDSVGKETRKLSGPASLRLRLDHVQKIDIRIGSNSWKVGSTEGLGFALHVKHLKKFVAGYYRD